MNKQIKLAVDCVVFDERNRLLLIKRRNPPFENQYALPGGFVEYGETTEAAAARELQEETGLIARRVRLIGIYSRPDRDPRGHVVSIAYLISVDSMNTKASSDATSAEFVEAGQGMQLAFDHNEIVSDAGKIR